MSKKYLYLFSEGNASMRELLGGKGANLAEMTQIGLPVPQGFTISTEACTQYYEDGRQINDEIQAQIMEYIAKMEEINGKKFGDLKNPLLVSVRSGARASMPGMMDTILNLGLNDEVVAAMTQDIADEFSDISHVDFTVSIHVAQAGVRDARQLYPCAEGIDVHGCVGVAEGFVAGEVELSLVAFLSDGDWTVCADEGSCLGFYGRVGIVDVHISEQGACHVCISGGPLHNVRLSCNNLVLRFAESEC